MHTKRGGNIAKTTDIDRSTRVLCGEMAKVCGLDIPPQIDSPITVDVDATKASGDGALTVVAVQVEGGSTAEVNVEEKEPKKFKLTFQPPKKEKYSLEIKWGDDPIQGSPLCLDLRPPNAKAVTIAEPPAGKLKTGQPIKICFDTSNAGRGEILSTCNGDEVGEIPVDVKRRDFTNKFDITFLPPHEDEYVVQVKWAGRSIKGSPFKIDLIPVNPNKVKASAPKIPTNPDDPIEMDISTKGAGNAKLTATCMCTIGGKIPVNIKKVNGTNYHLTVQPPERDILSLSVHYGGMHIPNSPFLVNTLPVDASKVKVTEPENPDIGQLVSYKLNTLHAGAGSLSASCKGDKSGPMDVEINKEGSTNNKYTVSFTPTVADVYSVGIKWGADDTPPKDVPGSPFNLSLLIPPDASKVQVGELHVPPEAGADEWVWLDLDCSEAGHGEVTAEAKDGNSKLIDVEIEKSDDDKYRVKFKADQAGKYHLNVLYGGSPIPRSPFSDINILDLSPKPHLVKHLETKQPKRRGGTAVLLFDTEEAGRGEFRARVAGLATGQTEVSYNPEPGSQHIYKVSFTPQKADTYLVDVYWENDPVTGSPFYVEISYPEEVKVTEPSEDSVSLKHPFHYKVDTSYAGPGELTAECQIKGKGENVKTTVTKDEADKYTITVYPKDKVEGVYSLSIFFNKSHVQRSPFEVDLIPKKVIETPCDVVRKENEEVKLTVPIATSPVQKPAPKPIVPNVQQMFIGDPFSCIIGKENLELSASMAAIATGEKTGPATIVTKRNEEDLPCFFFNPDVADRYTVEIKMNGTLLADNLFIIDYIYPIDTSKCVIFGAEGLNEKLPIDEKVSFGVDASKAGDAKLSVNVDGPSLSAQAAMIDVTSTEENPNIYHISYVPTVGGTHKINLLWAGEPIPDSPVVLDIESPDIPTYYRHKPFVIHFTTDCDAKKIESYAIHDDSSSKRYYLKIGKRRQGKLKLILYEKQLGIHSVHILIGGKEIHGSPFKIRFVESDPSACKIIDIPEKPLVGEETSFKVDTKRAGFGDLHIKATVPHGGKTEVTHKDHSDGLYSVVFTPKVAGNHSFQVSWDGVEIPDSPVKVSVAPTDPDSRQAASKVVYIVKDKKDKPIFDEVLSVSNPAFFKLCTKDAGKGQLEIRVRGPCEARVKVHVVDQTKGIYGCTVQPRASGKYLVSILWNGFSIPSSPFQLNFTKDKAYMINKLNLETDYFTLGTSEDYIIDCGKETGKLDVKCDPESAAKVELTSVKERDNTYLCRITPQNAGNHTIHVTYNDKDILNSPYVVQFYDADHHDHQRDETGEEDEEEERLSSLGSLNLGEEDQVDETPVISTSPKPALVKAYGSGLKAAYVGQEGNFTIETAEAGDGKLEVEVSGPKDTFQLSMRHHPDSDRKILARFDPKHAGDYTIDITWSGSPIPDSPFTVGIIEQRPLVYSIDL